MKRNGRIKNPTVIGAMLNLGNCLDLTDMASIRILQAAYRNFLLVCETSGVQPPKNIGDTDDKMIRKLDCAVIQYAHTWIEETGGVPYDSVRGAFIEGDPLYTDSKLRQKTHIQLCIRNADCIKGFFAPRIDVAEQYYRTIQN